RRLELPRPCGHQHLKLACLPISPSGQYRQRVYVVDGAHYTERVFNCKPLEAKKTLNFTSGAIGGFKRVSKDFRKGI
ncbi:hypothetical protein, partial [Pseudomonas alvandae]|uniref:hypothetical protein n=1 Tax=Pseudomonas canavaninivorans TaxID=2842348 RepID=UPI002B1E6BDB